MATYTVVDAQTLVHVRCISSNKTRFQKIFLTFALIHRSDVVFQLPGLFDGCQFYFYGEFCPPHPAKEDLIQMVKFGGGKILSREPKPDVDETLCLPTSHKANVTAVTLAPVAYHANPTSRNYRCTQYVIYDSLVDKKPHIWSTDSVCTVPVTWLMDCASNFAILELDMD